MTKKRNFPDSDPGVSIATQPSEDTMIPVGEVDLQAVTPLLARLLGGFAGA